MKRRLAIVATIAAVSSAALAPAPEGDLRPAEEARAQALFEQVRCVVCQHESIADSPAGVAADLRRLVREEVAAGRTDVQIKASLVDRYGDYILFRPPFRPGTLLLWLTPFATVILGGLAALLFARRGQGARDDPLTPQEESALAAILQRDRRDSDASSP